MTFLDERPLDFSRRETRELRDLFALAYSRMDQARHIARMAGLSPSYFPTGRDNMYLTWTALLAEMADQGLLRRLVETARDDPAVAGYRPRLAEMLTPNPPLRAVEPARPADWWRGDDRLPATVLALRQERLLEKQSRLHHIDVARGVARIAPSVARLEMDLADGQPAHGTGFLIQPDTLLTAYHNLIDSRGRAALSVAADFDDERGHRQPHLTARALVNTIHGDAARDWTVIRLDAAVDRPPLPLGSPYDVNVDDSLIIIQHPLGAPKQFALDALAVRYADDNIVQYVADTQKGSSGSPVFNARMQVIALHQAEAELTLPDEAGRPVVVWRNQGLRIDRVKDGLRRAGIPFAEPDPA